MASQPEPIEETPRPASASAPTFAEVLRDRISRREWLGRAGAATLAVAALREPAGASPPPATAPGRAVGLAFEPIEPGRDDAPRVAEGHAVDVLLRWGDPITADAPAFDPARQTAAAQAVQFGYNCDFVGFLPLPLDAPQPDRGLLAVNHEYNNPELMFPGYDPASPTREQVEVQWAAVGLSVVEIRRGGDGRWRPVLGSPLNRRVTAGTPMQISGPAAGADRLKTSADPEGRRVLGTMSNCSGGKTPWGTVLSGEENFQDQFANLAALPASDPRAAAHRRYGLNDGPSLPLWERFDPRFDLAREPNEPFRFGWVVEVDPYDPDWTPRKRTALGRFRHEAATVVATPGGKVAVYTGDDEKFEYVYKFVSAGTYDPGRREAARDLLDEGTLFVARFADDGTGRWIPLVFGEGPLTPANGFHSQADVLIETRRAADLAGGTPMDRPEDIEASPASGKVYIALTNNTDRGKPGRAGTSAANPRAANSHGQVVELVEAGGDHTAAAFTWDILLLCGDPADSSTYFAGYPREKVSPVSCPDNLTFDADGTLWIATDGQTKTLKLHDGIYAVPLEGPERGRVGCFFSGVPGGEVCGPEFTPDGTTLFAAIQHPGEGGTYENPLSRWPDAVTPPRPSVVAIRRTRGGRVGQPEG